MTTLSEMFKDCAFKVDYDTTQPTKTLDITIFNDPTKPYEIKFQCTPGDDFRSMVEFTTPFEMVRLYKVTLTVNKAAQPWTARLESQLNQQSITAEGMLHVYIYMHVSSHNNGV